MPDARLRLIPVTPAHAAAFALGRDHLSRLLGATLLDGWPEFPEALTMERDVPQTPSGATHWRGYFFVTLDGQLAGNGGFKGPPNEGVVELGYEIAPALRNRGLATEATCALMALAFADPSVRAVQAHTLAVENASCGVLRRCGFTRVETIVDPTDGEIWRWRCDQPAR
ncbi:MAG: GNAT family N-acetyltransferase [Archangium sp.]